MVATSVGPGDLPNTSVDMNKQTDNVIRSFIDYVFIQERGKRLLIVRPIAELTKRPSQGETIWK
jgi:hypothetical protein